MGATPCENLLMDFTKLPRAEAISTCTFSPWVEAFPTQTEKAREVIVKIHYPQIWTAPDSRFKQYTSICSQNSSGTNMAIKNKVEITHSLLATELRKSRAHEPDTQTATKEILPGNSSEVGSCPAHGPLNQVHPHQTNWVFTP